MLRIGELAELAGISTRAIRHYHQLGLLPEPQRAAAGHRAYELRDAVLLLRIRRLVELGLRLDQAAAILAEDAGRDLHEILAELDADLAEQQRRIGARRQRIAELLANASAANFSAQLVEVLTDLDRVTATQPGVARERLITALFELISGDVAPGRLKGYHAVFAEAEFTERTHELSRRFDDLRGRPPEDPLVAELAELAADLGQEVGRLLPDDIRNDIRNAPVGGSRQRDFVRAAAVGLDPAQARCFELLLRGLRDRWGLGDTGGTEAPPW
ncbi:MAG TPA: MerR family transcriptional regulator [Pseudonocardiaceae bacterium]|jgi:DNA-binding transcriptional MerR regulator|nr:MerR family transcriptional regulator [Pseudonocardiaceae bacterium]